MQWAGIAVNAPDQETEDAVVYLLLNSGCGGVALNNESHPKLVTAYLPIDDRSTERLRQIAAALTLLPSLGIPYPGEPAITVVDEEDWANSWRAYFKPLRIGRKLVVSPPWENPELGDRDILITIDPGMAFGTGTHGTTQMCLILLEEYLNAGDSIADIGTGSGILSIAASKLGALSVLSVDNDPLAVKIASENARINMVSGDVTDQFPFGKTFDLVLANIIADTLIQMAGSLASITKDGGILIVSGVIDERQNDVRLFIEGAGFSSLETRTQGEWVALVFRRAGI